MLQGYGVKVTIDILDVSDREAVYAWADKTAKTILNGVRKNSRRILIGPDARMFDLLVRMLPATYQWIFTKAVQMQAKKATRRAKNA